MRRLMALKTWLVEDIEGKPRLVPLEDTPAPISMSGSSNTIPPVIGIPPVPPYSAVIAHLWSASVSRLIGMVLIPVE
jgi:hypothetical protein